MPGLVLEVFESLESRRARFDRDPAACDIDEVVPRERLTPALDLCIVDEAE